MAQLETGKFLSDAFEQLDQAPIFSPLPGRSCELVPLTVSGVETEV